MEQTRRAQTGKRGSHVLVFAAGVPLLAALLVTPGAAAPGSAAASTVTTIMLEEAMSPAMVGASPDWGFSYGDKIVIPPLCFCRSPFKPPWVPPKPPWPPGRPPWLPPKPPWFPPGPPWQW